MRLIKNEVEHRQWEMKIGTYGGIDELFYEPK